MRAAGHAFKQVFQPDTKTRTLPDVRRRTANKILVTGVNVRASFSVCDETRVMLLPYEPHEEVRKHLNQVPLFLEPKPSQGLVPEGFKTVMASHHALGLVDKNGPLMTKKSGAHNVLDSVDGSPYECRVATHAGKPMDCLAPSSSSSTARACPRARDHSDSP